MSKQKIIYFVFFGLVIIFSLFAWHSLRDLLFDKGEGNIFVTIIVFLLLAGFAGAMILFFESLGLLLVSFGAGLALFVPTLPFKPIYLLVLALGIGAMVPALRQALKEKGGHLKIQVFEIIRPALAMFFTVLVLIVSVAIYFSPPAQELGVEIKIPRPLFNLVFDATTGFLNNQIKGQATQSSGLPIGLAGLPGISPADITKALAGQSLDMSKILTEEAKDNLYKTVNEQINFFVKPYKRYLPYGLAVAVFLSLKSVGFIFIWLSILLSQLIFNIMKSLRFVSIKKEMAEREVIEISN